MWGPEKRRGTYFTWVTNHISKCQRIGSLRGDNWICSSLTTEKWITRELKRIKIQFKKTASFSQTLEDSSFTWKRNACVWAAEKQCVLKVRGKLERKSGYLARGGFVGDLSAPLWIWVDLRSGGWRRSRTRARTFALCRSAREKSVRLCSRPLSSLIHWKADTSAGTQSLFIQSGELDSGLLLT